MLYVARVKTLLTVGRSMGRGGTGSGQTYRAHLPGRVELPRVTCRNMREDTGRGAVQLECADGKGGEHSYKSDARRDGFCLEIGDGSQRRANAAGGVGPPTGGHKGGIRYPCGGVRWAGGGGLDRRSRQGTAAPAPPPWNSMANCTVFSSLGGTGEWHIPDSTKAACVERPRRGA